MQAIAETRDWLRDGVKKPYWKNKKADGMGMPSAGSHTHSECDYQARTSTTLRE
jgi:hypothetical protein